MNRIGVYICNYNGKDFTIGCINSVKEQTYEDVDIYVVDNASTDGSVEAINNIFSDVKIIKNEENIGGAGGFDRGLKDGLNRNYEYIVLLDNDVLLDQHVFYNMYRYLENNKDVGIVGSKVMIMDLPDTIQDYGDFLDFKKYKEKNAYIMDKDSEKIPDINECDYVPTCCVMVRKQALLEAGTMPADNFIYYDDIELSHKMKIRGWKVVALGNAKIWHKGGFRKATINTFSRYYFLRNRLNFFAKYIDDSEIDNYVEQTLEDVFRQLYGFNSKNAKEMLETTFYAFDDFLHGVRGKADDYKIMNIGSSSTTLEKIVKDIKCIHIILDDIENITNNQEQLRIILRIFGDIQRFNSNIEIHLSLADEGVEIMDVVDALKKEKIAFEGTDILPIVKNADNNIKYDIVLKKCEHVSQVKKNILPIVYIDRFSNCIASIEEYKYFTGTNQACSFFKNTYRNMLKKAVFRVRNNID